MGARYIEDTFQIASDIANIAEVEKMVDQHWTMLKLNDELYGKLLISVIEAVNNAIVHGNKCDASKKVTITYVITEKDITYTIKDAGKGFDHYKVPDPTFEDNLENISGRGIFLMKAYADEVEFSDGGSTIKLRFML